VKRAAAVAFRFLADPDPHVRGDAALASVELPRSQQSAAAAVGGCAVGEKHHWAAIQLLRGYVAVSKPGDQQSEVFSAAFLLGSPNRLVRSRPSHLSTKREAKPTRPGSPRLLNPWQRQRVPFPFRFAGCCTQRAKCTELASRNRS
jgi:hypothetical protein